MQVISIEFVGYEETVYDLETAAGTFVAGGSKNGILVKNTDSCFVKFPLHKSDYSTKEEFMKAIFELAKKCARYCTSRCKPPIELAFEKVMCPLDLFAKKRYGYLEWTDPRFPDSDKEKKPIVHYKGLQLIRRDTCKHVKEELNEIFNIIMNSEIKR